MPINYSKWDQLQLSDDSDIEVHPNVDKKSMIRWKQRDIHEKREQRKIRLRHFDLEEKMNAGLINRVDRLIGLVEQDGRASIEGEISRLRSAVPDYPNVEKNVQPSEDHMVLSLILQVVEAVKAEPTDDRLAREFKTHKGKLEARQKEIGVEREKDIAEQKKFITSDDLHTAWDSKTLINKTVDEKTAPQPKQKAKQTTIETLNSPTVTSADGPKEEEEDEVMDDDARKFCTIRPMDFTAMLDFLSKHKHLVSQSMNNAIMVEAFTIGLEEKVKPITAMNATITNYIEKALVLQYCCELGRDGVNLFFKRMTQADPKARKMFVDDVSMTAKRVIDRTAELRSERNTEQREQIQLVSSDPTVTISFEVPDGPPAEKIEIVGDEAGDIDPEQVRLHLQRRWEIFCDFDEKLQTALKKKSLDAVNEILGDMDVPKAERIVELLQESGIMSFETSEIIDTTKGEQLRKVPTKVDGPAEAE